MQYYDYILISNRHTSSLHFFTFFNVFLTIISSSFLLSIKKYKKAIMHTPMVISNELCIVIKQVPMANSNLNENLFQSIEIGKDFFVWNTRISHIVKNPKNVEIDAACRPINRTSIILTQKFTIAPYTLVVAAPAVLLFLK